MTFTRGEPEQDQPNPGDFAWGWIGAVFVLTFCALVWGVVGEFLYCRCASTFPEQHQLFAAHQRFVAGYPGADGLSPGSPLGDVLVPIVPGVDELGAPG